MLINTLSQWTFLRRMGFYHQKATGAQNYYIFTIIKEEPFHLLQWKYYGRKSLSRHFLVQGEFQETVKQDKGGESPAQH